MTSRVVVTGMAGAGKSTFSRQLAAKTGLPLIHLDLHSWRPGWVRVPHDELIEVQRQLLAGQRWIVDSNDVDEDLLVAHADTLVVITTQWWVCSWRAFRRGLRRPAEDATARGLRRVAFATHRRRVGHRLAQLARPEDGPRERPSSCEALRRPSGRTRLEIQARTRRLPSQSS